MYSAHLALRSAVTVSVVLFHDGVMAITSAGPDHPQILTLVFCWRTILSPISEGKQISALALVATNNKQIPQSIFLILFIKMYSFCVAITFSPVFFNQYI